MAAIAGHQKLGKLIWIFDNNRITIEGGTDLSTATDQAKRFMDTDGTPYASKTEPTPPAWTGPSTPRAPRPNAPRSSS